MIMILEDEIFKWNIIEGLSQHQNSYKEQNCLFKPLLIKETNILSPSKKEAKKCATRTS